MTKCWKHNEKRSPTLRMLYYWGRLLGVNGFTLSKSREIKFSYLSIIYAFFLSAVYLYMLKHIVQERIGMVLPGETPLGLIVDAFVLVFASIENFSIWFSSALQQNRAKSIINGFETIDKISRNLNLCDDHEKSLRKLGILLMVINALYAIWAGTIISSAPSDKIAWLIFPILGMISYNVATLFIWIVVVVRQKFRRLNEKVTKLMDHEEVEMLRDEEALEFVGSSRSISPSQKIDAISQLHRELRDVMSLIMEHFSLIMLMKMLKQFLLIFLDVHIMYRYLKGCESFNMHNFIYMSHIAFWAIIPLALVTIISNVCGSTSIEANKTGNILHGIINDFKVSGNTPGIAKSNVLSLDLLKNRVTISIFGLVELDNFLVYSTIATATSYLTIMLQFDDK